MVYTPIYAELSGLGSLVGAGLVSIGTAWTFTVPLFVFAAAATWMLLSAFLCRYVPRGM